MNERMRPLPDLVRALGRIVAGFNLAYTLTASPDLAHFALSTPLIGVVLIAGLVALPIIMESVLALLGRVPRVVWALAAACYALAVLSWPFFIWTPLDSSGPPWLVAMLIPAVLRTTMATRSIRTTVLGAALLTIGVDLVETFAGGMPLSTAIGQSLPIALVGVLLGTLILAVQRAAERTSSVQQAALQKVAAARFDDVTETERVRTDALVHDTILTTLLQAASAETDDETDRARRMAQNALRVIAHVSRSKDLGAGVRFRAAISAHEHDLDPAIRSFDIVLDDAGLEDLLLPTEAADALLVAMTEAMDNSVRHAEAARRVVRLRALGPDGVWIGIEDDGRGFDYPAAIGVGIRERIVTPMLSVEGRAELSSAVGDGTSVRLSWGSVSVADVRSIEARLREVQA